MAHFIKQIELPWIRPPSKHHIIGMRWLEYGFSNKYAYVHEKGSRGGNSCLSQWRMGFLGSMVVLMCDHNLRLPHCHSIPFTFSLEIAAWPDVPGLRMPAGSAGQWFLFECKYQGRNWKVSTAKHTETQFRVIPVNWLEEPVEMVQDMVQVCAQRATILLWVGKVHVTSFFFFFAYYSLMSYKFFLFFLCLSTFG